MTSTRPLHNDGGALPILLAVMEAAGRHDCAAAQAGCDAALDIIEGRAKHKSRTNILDARVAAEEGHWYMVHNRAYQAICGLTHVFPPDPSLCPPAPGETPHVASTCTGCGTGLTPGARFCYLCGQGVGG